jgi:hypothetical protein
MINRGKGMLITDGLIMKKRKIMNMSGRRDSGAHLVWEEAKREGFSS